MAYDGPAELVVNGVAYACSTRLACREVGRERHRSFGSTSSVQGHLEWDGTARLDGGESVMIDLTFALHDSDNQLLHIRGREPAACRARVLGQAEGLLAIESNGSAPPFDCD